MHAYIHHIFTIQCFYVHNANHFSYIIDKRMDQPFDYFHYFNMRFVVVYYFFFFYIFMCIFFFLIFFNETGHIYFQGNGCGRVFSLARRPDILFYLHVPRNEMDGVFGLRFSRVLYTNTYIIVFLLISNHFKFANISLNIKY